jgi:hypothetical protein
VVAVRVAAAKAVVVKAAVVKVAVDRVAALPRFDSPRLSGEIKSRFG